MRNEIKKMFNQIEYPKDQIGTVFFGIQSKEKDIQIRTALIQRGNTDDTVDQIFDDYGHQYKIIFKPFEIHYSVLESIKANRETSIDLITSTYVNTKNEEYKNYIESHILKLLKMNIEIPIDFINTIYEITKNEEYKNYINSGKYLESSNFNNSITQ